MPLYKRIIVNDLTKVLIWKIQEPLSDLSRCAELTQKSKKRLESMKSILHQQGFASIRLLLKEAGYLDADVFYDEFGKPHLNDGTFISMTHSHTFSAIILSKKDKVGIDIEKQRDGIIKIAHKFTPMSIHSVLFDRDALVSKLTIVWGAKESLYKIYGKKKLAFLKNIHIEEFALTDKKTTGVVNYQDHVSNHVIHFLKIDEFICVYAF